MTQPSFSSSPRTASEAILAGYAVCNTSDAVALLDNAGQTTVVTVKPLGIAATDGASGGEIAVIDGGDVMIVAGSGGLAANEFFVAEAATGKCIAFTQATYTAGQLLYFLGRTYEAIAANAKGRACVDIQLITVYKT